MGEERADTDTDKRQREMGEERADTETERQTDGQETKRKAEGRQN